MSSALLQPLRNRNYRLLFIGQTTSGLGSSFAGIAIAFAVLQVTGSVAAVGLALAAKRLPLAAFVLLGGVVGDRLPRRTVMLASDAVRFLVQALIAVLLLSGAARLWQLLALFFVLGSAQAFFNPAAIGLVPEIVPTEQLQQSNALLSFSRNSAVFVGQLLGGAVVTLTSPGVAFAVDSVSYVVSAAALAAMAVERSLRLQPAGNLVAQLRDGWTEFRARDWLWVGVLHIALLNSFALVSFFALGPVVAQRSLGGGAAWGVVGAAFALGLIVGSWIGGRWQPSRSLVAAFGVVVLAAPQLALLAIPAPLAFVAVAAAFGGAQASVWSVFWTTTMQREIPKNAIARVTAYSQVGSLVLAPIGFAVVGYVAQILGVATLLWAGAAWIVVSSLVVVALPPIRSYRASLDAVAIPAAA